MINKEQFIELVENHKKWNHRIDEVSTILNSYIWESDWVSYGGELFDKILNILFNYHAVDAINWWLYEKFDASPHLTMHDGEGNEIPTETVEDLWEVVKDDRI